MIIKTGVDLMQLDRFTKSHSTGKSAFEQQVFTPQEIRQNNPEQLAGIFCLKEAVMKALELPHDSWQMISCDRKENGKVSCTLLDEKISRTIISLDTSLSHDGGLIIAIAVCLIDV